MASHNWGIARLQRNRLAQHVELVAEDWNEPDSWGVGDSAVLVEGPTIVVVSPLNMSWRGSPSHLCIVVGTYIGDELKTTSIVDRETGDLVYAPDTQVSY